MEGGCSRVAEWSIGGVLSVRVRYFDIAFEEKDPIYVSLYLLSLGIRFLILHLFLSINDFLI